MRLRQQGAGTFDTAVGERLARFLKDEALRPGRPHHTAQHRVGGLRRAPGLPAGTNIDVARRKKL